LAGINHEIVRETQMPVARVLSGNGTVFHDAWKLNINMEWILVTRCANIMQKCLKLKVRNSDQFAGKE